jgi:4-hydroxythreonine-4-phosphate dehydrogenase
MARRAPLVVSVGCPSGVGPEVSVAAAARVRDLPRILVGDERTLREAADVMGVPQKLFVRYGSSPGDPRRIEIYGIDPPLDAAHRRPGQPSRAAGAAQLAWLDAAYALAKRLRGALVTGPINKAAVARSGAPGSKNFIGHTEWLRERDRAKSAVMCFASDELVTSLVTTHVPFSLVPKRLSAESVADATYFLAVLLRRMGHARPRIAVCSLNPHAGEDELFGSEERVAIRPGIERARRRLRRAKIEGPIGAETAYRRARAGVWDGVVAMYHDQATIPMKLVAFGDAVNVTMGLSLVRTSVDHGTGYDIAWRGEADAEGMEAALRLAARLLQRAKRA